MISRALRVGALLLTIVAGSGCYDPPEIAMALPEGPPTDREGWAIWSVPDPMLVLVENGAYRVFMRCSKATWGIELNARPMSGAVQPPMTVELNDIKWVGSPKEKIMGGGPPIVEVKIAVDGESVSREAVVEGFRRNERLRLIFNGVDRPLPPIPTDLGDRVGNYCLKVL